MDLDADGRMDMVSGSWPGELYLFRGGEGRTFAAPVKLKHADGRTINIGGGRRRSGDGMVLVAGDATFSEDGKAILYDGERFEIPDGQHGGITGTASVVHVADWDGDGDLDLVVGNIDGRMSLVPNEGTAKEWSFGKAQPLVAGGEAAAVAHHAGPTVADWDGDGDLDLLVGAADGGVTLFRNDGTRREPRLAAGVALVAPSERGERDVADEPRPGSRAKPCAADWNGDGRMDLLVGDFSYLKVTPPEPTPEEKAAQDAAREELEGLQADYAERVGRLEAEPPEDPAKAKEELAALVRRMDDLRRRLPRDHEDHGWVWLHLRRAAAPVAGGG